VLLLSMLLLASSFLSGAWCNSVACLRVVGPVKGHLAGTSCCSHLFGPRQRIPMWILPWWHKQNNARSTVYAISAIKGHVRGIVSSKRRGGLCMNPYSTSAPVSGRVAWKTAPSVVLVPVLSRVHLRAHQICEVLMSRLCRKQEGEC